MGGPATYVPPYYRRMFFRDIGVATGLGLAAGALWRIYQNRLANKMADFNKQYAIAWAKHQRQ